MRTDRLRAVLIALLAAAAVLAVVGHKLDAAWLVWLSYAPFFVAVVLLVDARRRIAHRRRGTVFDREAKTSETRTRADE